MPYTGRYLANVTSGNIFVESEYSFLAKALKVGKNFSSQTSNNTITPEVTPSVLNTSGVKLTKSPSVAYSQGCVTDAYLAKDLTLNKKAYYTCTKGVLNGEKICLISGVLYRLSDSGLNKLVTFTTEGSANLDDMDVYYETDSTLHIKVTSLSTNRDILADTRLASGFVLRTALTASYSQLIVLDKSTLVDTVVPLTTIDKPQGILTKVLENDDRIIFFMNLRVNSPINTYNHWTAPQIVAAPVINPAVIRTVVFTKATQTYSQSVSSFTPADNSCWMITKPAYAATTATFYLSDATNLYKITVGLDGEFTTELCTFNNLPTTLSEVRLPTHEYIGSAQQPDFTNIPYCYLHMCQVSLVHTYSFNISTDKYILRTMIPSSVRGVKFVNATTINPEPFLFLFKVDPMDSLKLTYVTHARLKTDYIGIMPTSATTYDLISASRIDTLVIRSEKLYLTNTYNADYELGSYLSTGDLLVLKTQGISRLSSRIPGVRVYPVQSPSNPVQITIEQTSYSEVDTINKYLKVTAADTGAVLENTSLVVTVVNGKFSDGSAVQTLTSDSNGIITLVLSRSIRGQLSIRVDTTASFDLTEMSRSWTMPVVSPVGGGNWTKWDRYTATPGTTTITLPSGSQTAIIVAAGSGGITPGSAYLNPPWVNRWITLESGAGSSGGVSITKYTTTDSIIKTSVADYGVKIPTTASTNGGVLLATANPGNNGGLYVADGNRIVYTGGVGAAGPGHGLGDVTYPGIGGADGNRIDGEYAYSMSKLSRPGIYWSTRSHAGSTQQVGQVQAWIYDASKIVSPNPDKSKIVVQYCKSRFTYGYPVTVTWTTNTQDGIYLTNPANFNDYINLGPFAFTADEDFCIEFFCKVPLATIGTSGALLLSSDWLTAGINNSWSLSVNKATSTVGFTTYTNTGAAQNTARGPVFPYDTPVHVCVERFNGVISIYVAGVSDKPTQTTNANKFSSSAAFNIVVKNMTTAWTSARTTWDIRFSRQAIYKGDFTPPTCHYEFA